MRKQRWELIQMREVPNIDAKTVEGFGDEWTRFDQSGMSDLETIEIFGKYFSVFPWSQLMPSAVGFDLGCGSGRWARIVAPRVGTLHCVEPSSAMVVARRNLASFENCEFHQLAVDELPFDPASMDFGYSLGVLHHIPDTKAALRKCVRVLKPNAPFLLYLYYSFDNKPSWYRLLWKCSEAVRALISRMPPRLRNVTSDAVAAGVYWPLSRLAKVAERAGLNVQNWPLTAYRNRSFYTMRTDSLDRFGTRLEQRFSRAEIESMMLSAGLVNVKFREDDSFWCAVGFAKPTEV
jgi:ubiquinone/menaquinone biosynthesis C-methylase UbiE